MAFLDYQNALQNKEALQKQVSELSYTENTYNNYITYNKYKDSLTKLGESLISPNDGLRDFIGELEKNMPSEISLLSANCTKEGISMNITVTTKAGAAKTIQQLRSFSTIKEIAVGQITEHVDDAGLKTLAFSVQCKYNFIPVILPAPSASAKPQPSSGVAPSGAPSSAAPSGSGLTVSSAPAKTSAAPPKTSTAPTVTPSAASVPASTTPAKISPVAPSVGASPSAAANPSR